MKSTFDKHDFSANNISLCDMSTAFSHEDACKILGKTPTKTALKSLSLLGKTVCVTGGAGSIGSEICRQALKSECKRLVVIERHELGAFELDRRLKAEFGGRYSIVIGDIRDENKVRSTLNKFKPDILFHTAAYKHVPLMEGAVCEAVKNNVFGTLNLINNLDEGEVKNFVLISSDKAVNPSSVMGATKRVAEMLVTSSNSSAVCSAVRFGNVFGSSGSVVPIFVNQILKDKTVTVTDKRMERYFMTVTEAVSLVIQASATSKNGQVFVLDMGKPINVYTLAENLISHFGLKPHEEVKIEVTGVRAGEKLFEELRYDDESVDNGALNGAFIAKLKPVDKSLLTSSLNALKTAVEKEDDEQAKRLLFTLINE